MILLNSSLSKSSGDHMINELSPISTKEYCVGSKSDGDNVQVPNC